MTRLVLFAVFAVLAAAPAAPGGDATVVRAARYLDVVAGRLVEPAVVVVEGERIAALNPPRVPDDAATIDLGDRTLAPGLIDAHVHLTLDFDRGWEERRVKESAADFALRGARNAERTLRAGFTTVRDIGGFGWADVALARAIDRGLVLGPSVIPAAHPITATGGHCDHTGLAPGILERGPEGGVADGPDEVTKAVRHQVKHGARVVKLCATAGVLSFEKSVGARQLSDEELAAAVAEARRHGLAVAAHAHGSEGIVAAVRAGVDSIEHGSMLSDEAIALMKERGTFLVPTVHLREAIDRAALPAALLAKMDEVVPQARKSLERAIGAGVRIALGTDAAVFPHGENAKELSALVDHGMSPAAAVRAATVGAAELLRLDDRGRIASGLRADLIAVPGDPLADVRLFERVSWVMKGGTPIVGPPEVDKRDSATETLVESSDPATANGGRR